jgi:D-glycero-alpha-D-manno-heptose-7-phosphate kinase
MYAAARSAGALGGKLLGAGGGGFLLLYADEARQEPVREALSPCVYVPFEFEPYGARVIHYD